MEPKPGNPYPLGATWDGRGVNFALFSENAFKVELCLFESVRSAKEFKRIPLTAKTEHVWHTYLPGVKPGCLYGYRVHGHYAPDRGHRFNPAKILVDPYAKMIGRPLRWDNSLFAYNIGKEDFETNKDDNAAYAPLCEVVDPGFDWKNDRRPNNPLNQTLIYETHVKGLTCLHPDVPEHLRGTYAGLVSEPILKHLTRLGVTAVELLPVQQCADEHHLFRKGLSNYWGYSTLAYFAPDSRFSRSGNPVREFKEMVRSLHAAGIEVILDVVYNHTPEGNHLGPTLSLRGIDNEIYYRLNPDHPRYYTDFTGCGNTLNTPHPKVLQFIIDSLRYWILEMHVDGFRFDLASALARGSSDFDKMSPFFKCLQGDPVISRIKLIAEPWDIGDRGYHLGNFPKGWSEWNGKYRDTVRKFWKGDEGSLGAMTTRFSGSSDLYQWDNREPQASINYITAHDGFTLHDLVSYKRKHNETNLEENKDGTSENFSYNHGVEGSTQNAKVKTLREKQKRNMMSTLMLSQGVPMINGGDEFGRTQSGNNNAYCQDNEISWYHWRWTAEQKQFLEFTCRVIQIRKTNPVLWRRRFFLGSTANNSSSKDITWFSSSGREMSALDWGNGTHRCVGIRLDGDALTDVDEHGNRLVGDTLLIIMNAYYREIPFTLPTHRAKTRWEIILDTHLPEPGSKKRIERGGRPFQLKERSLVVLRLVAKKPRQKSKQH